MAQFNVYENKNPETRRTFPYLLDVQADILEELPTRVVVPLVDSSLLRKLTPIINPQFTINETEVVMLTPQISGVPLHVLGTRVCSLEDKRSLIVAALDFMFVGF